MKVIFAGTPEFARVALKALLRAGFDVPLVLTQPDRPAGRGLQLQASPVKAFALEHGIAVAQPRSLRQDGKYPEDATAARAAIEAAQADVMVVAAYGLILPQWVLGAMSVGANMSADGPPLGAKAPLGGSELRAARSVGVNMSADGPPLGAKAPSQRTTRSEERGGQHERRRAALRREGPLGGQRTTRSEERGGQQVRLSEYPRKLAAALARRSADSPRD